MTCGELLVPTTRVVSDYRTPEVLGWRVALHNRNFPGASECIENAICNIPSHTHTPVFFENKELANLVGVISAEICSVARQDEAAQLAVHLHQLALSICVSPE